MRRRDRTSGIALVAALALMAVGSAVLMLLFMRTMDEIRHGRDDAAIVQTLLLAQGGATLGVSLLHNDVRQELDVVVSAFSDPVGSWSFGVSGVNENIPRADSVASDLAQVATALQSRIDQLVCGAHTLEDGSTFTLRIHVTATACGQPLPPDTRLGDGHFVSGKRREEGGNQTYALPFVMVSDGQMGEFRRRVVTQGEYRFVVGRRSFARYALFTDRHSSAGSNGPIWFTGDTLFDGPVHTNGNFNFFDRPWFGGEVSSAGVNNRGRQGAIGFDNDDGQFFTAAELEPGGNFPNLDVCRATWNGRCVAWWENRPQFTGGVDWRSDYIPLPQNAHDQRALATADGIRITTDIRRMELYAADAQGNPLRYDSNADATYQYFEVEVYKNSRWRTEYYRVSRNGVLEYKAYNSNDWQTLTNAFNGVIYVDDYLESLTGPGRVTSNDPGTAGPALASFSQLTIVPEDGARITGDIVYQDQPCEGHLRRENGQVVRPKCENLDAQNVLGIFSPTGNILIGHNTGDSNLNAPRDVRIQASLMTSQGIVGVENYGSGSARGAVQLLGGIIERDYGAFGTFNAADNTMSTGYSRQFTFDPRLARGLTPPYFPTIGVDGVDSVFTFTFGHREQVF